MKLAPRVVVQTEEHRALLRKNFGRESVVIPNGIDIELYRRIRNYGHSILWVANWREVKRPELVGDLARLLPECRFVMCGGIGDHKLYERIRSQLPNNVLVRGRICDSELFDAYQDASVLINTSDFEGIPVTFDEAWACELPVVSLNIDPDDIIVRNGLGFVSRSIEQMALDIQQLLTEPNRVKEIGQRSRKFVELNHNIKRTSEQVERLLSNGIVARGRCSYD
jgi:glycosyltransferase involved in cell wall biosynthesis